MSERFSPALKLGDLNDFIAPSQSCVVSLNGKRKETQALQSNLVEIRRPNQVLDVEPVKVTLHDCLACSGCITSAETVLLEQQSLDEFMSRVSSGQKTVIVSVSPQSRASLANYYGITPLQALKKLTTFLKGLGVRAVFDTSCSRDLSLIESCEEFIRRYTEHKSSNSTKEGSHLPVLASACPGWICYAEKTLEPFILHHISSVKSSQQVMGALIKRYACYNMGLKPEDIYHVTIMPCYDKKLEASRDDFIFSVDNNKAAPGDAGGTKLTEVDCVLTSGEMLDLLQAKCVDFTVLDECQLDKMLTNVDESGYLYGARGGSGGYAECIFRYAARVLFGKELSGPSNFRTLRNSDFRELTLEVDGEVVLRFACCYGFRNIQNLVRKLKAGKCDYQFVEVMACPSGCLAGGGQIKPRKGQSSKDLIQALETIYLKEVNVFDPFNNPIIKELYAEWLHHPGSEQALEIAQTSYHHREKSVTSQISNW